MSSSIHGYLRSRLLEVASPATRTRSQPLSNWASTNIRLDGRPFSFEGHAYLRAIYDDTSPHVCLVKAAQVGGSVWAILRSVHACLSQLSVMYCFPTRTDVLEFSKSRITPLIADNPILARSITDVDSAGLKKIGDSYLYLRGMQSAIGIKSVPADMIVFDELDEATPDAKKRALERLSHSGYKRVVELSNPSIPGYGIDEVFQRSDQRHWHLRCPGCQRWTSPVLEFPRELGRDIPIFGEGTDGSVRLVCPGCGDELDPEMGEWVPLFPGRESRGYLISQLFSSTVTPKEIHEEYRTTRFPERFYTLKVGIPWADRSNRLQPDEIFACCGDHQLATRMESGQRCTMGVDVGKQHHVVISAAYEGGRRKIVYLGVHASFEELDALIDDFRVQLCVIDAMPEIHATRAFAQRHRGRVYVNYFNESQRGSAAWNYGDHIVQENRTEALDAARDAIRQREVVLPRRCPLVETFATHLCNDVKQLQEDEETGEAKFRYIRTGADHFGLAFVYEHIAAERSSRTSLWIG
jgi:hypothetical protein